MTKLNMNALAGLIPRPLPSDPKTRANVEQVLRQGYVVIPDCFSSKEAGEARAEINRLSGDNPWTGRTEFEGSRTNRIFALPDKSRVFDKFYICPEVLALNDYFLDPDYLLYVIQSIVINKGEGQQIVHHDDGSVRQPRPRAPFSAAIIVPLDDFTPFNGATRMIPQSHLWGQEKPLENDTIPMVCPAGSVIYWLGTTYHSGGPNNSNASRHAITVQYCQPYIRPLENLMLCVDPRKLPEIPEKIVDMMGYKSAFPFLGSVDGMNPRKGMLRLMRWLKGPVDYNPPTFAKEDGRKDELKVESKL